MENVGYYNGTIDCVENLLIPFLDRAVYFGDGVYDAFYARKKRPFTMQEHLDRLFLSAKQIDVVMPISYQNLCDLICELLKKTDDGEKIIYVQVSRGSGFRNHAYPQTKANLLITITPKTVTPCDKIFNVVSYPDVRYKLCSIKTLNLLPNVLASNYASVNKCEEAVLHIDGRVTECAHSNVHLIKNNTLITAPCDGKILDGIARRHLISACKKLNFPVLERAFTLREIKETDSLIITSAGTFCTPCFSIDNSRLSVENTMISTLQNILYGEFYDE